ncbi:hypothetical protein [Colwellia piezophila]|uniref:hypothetical protein n=1 Tax=Colwellia piezophila TaxID=211668 RepID=UPI00037F1F86|nr:hypothetical protein [Colwellia piezophila]
MFCINKFSINFSFKKSTLVILTTLVGVFGLTACATIPGETKTEQIQTIDQLVENTLADLYQQNPEAQAQIENSIGYAIMNNKITKIPVVGAGAGYGVAIHNKSQKRHYIQMVRFDVGGGWGARSVRPVIIFTDEQVFNDFIDGMWSANAGAEAAAKVGDVGTSAGAATGNEGNDKGYITHMITDKGVSATVTVGLIRVKPISLKK